MERIRCLASLIWGGYLTTVTRQTGVYETGSSAVLFDPGGGTVKLGGISHRRAGASRVFLRGREDRCLVAELKSEVGRCNRPHEGCVESARRDSDRGSLTGAVRPAGPARCPLVLSHVPRAIRVFSVNCRSFSLSLCAVSGAKFGNTTRVMLHLPGIAGVATCSQRYTQKRS